MIPAPIVDLVSLSPVIVLSLFAMGVLILDLFIGKDKTVLVFLSLLGLFLAAVSSLAKGTGPIYSFSNSYVVDTFSIFLTFVFAISSALAIMLSVSYNKEQGIKIGEYYSIILFCTVGMIVLASSADLIMIFLGIEIVSISLYILAGIRRTEKRSNEAALKYFLLGAFASGFLLYGMALVYGATGTTHLKDIASVLASSEFKTSPILLMGVVLLVVGFGFKVASVPFHMWAPDVYQGSATPVTAFMSVGPKAAVFAAFFRIFVEGIPNISDYWDTILCIVAVITMFVGNLGAIIQDNMKRLLAYSSISHAGYILVALIAKNSLGMSSLLFYMLAYAFMSFGAFAIIIILDKQNGDNLEVKDYAGLGFKHPVIAVCMSIFLLSLGGLPPFAGFVGKFYIFSAAVKEGYITLVVLGVLNSAISFYYYLRVIVYMYMKEPEGDYQVQPSLAPFSLLVIGIAVFGTIELGIFPGPVISWTMN